MATDSGDWTRSRQPVNSDGGGQVPAATRTSRGTARRRDASALTVTAPEYTPGLASAGTVTLIHSGWTGPVAAAWTGTSAGGNPRANRKAPPSASGIP